MSEKDKSPESNTMERILPDELSPDETTGAETLRLHMERYKFARQNLVAGSVLDLACGVGYGTALICEDKSITSALGVDISDEAVKYARRRYGCERVTYVCSDALQFSPGRQFDNIVSLETIEHVDDPDALFEHLVSLLAPKGRLIASVPVTPSVDANPHHRSNFSAKSFQRMASGFPLKYLDSLTQIQPFDPVSIGLRQETRTHNLRSNLPMFYVKHPSHFAMRIWSTLRHGFVNMYITVVWERGN
jgi:SAM-dependent methyltransferase